MKLSEIWVYPVKGLAGIPLTTAVLERRGIEHDRRWMVVDEAGVFLSQREHAQMALGKPRLGPDALYLTAPGMPELRVPFHQPALATVQATIWDDVVEAEIIQLSANEWLSEWLGQPCRLVRLPDTSLRLIPPKYQRNGDDHVSLADGYPFLIISQSSLDDLNARMEQPLPMNRFRPNFVVTGTLPFEEDTFAEFTIGEAVFAGVKPCARCNVTTIDQETTEAGKEPLRTLSGYRRLGSKVLFGENLLLVSGTTVRLGDALKVLTRKPSPFSLVG